MTKHRRGAKVGMGSSASAAAGAAAARRAAGAGAPSSPAAPPTPPPPPSADEVLVVASAAVASIEELAEAGLGAGGADQRAVAAALGQPLRPRSEQWPPPPLAGGTPLPVRGGWPPLPPADAPRLAHAVWARQAGERLQDLLDTLQGLEPGLRARRKDLLQRLEACLDRAEAARLGCVAAAAAGGVAASA